jgi:hypothetical protein
MKKRCDARAWQNLLSYKFSGEDAGKMIAHAEGRCRFGCAWCTKERAARRRANRLGEMLEQSINNLRKKGTR